MRGRSRAKITGGADRDRTGDPLLAKQVLSQLSYSPKCEALFPAFADVSSEGAVGEKSAQGCAVGRLFADGSA